MLVYLNGGLRRYDQKPILAGKERKFWEFQVVLKGRIARVNRDQPARFRSNTLWLSRAGSKHGWTGVPGRASEVAVFHFQHVPSPLETLADRYNEIAIGLDKAQIARIRFLFRQARHHLTQPGPGLFLCSDHVLAELSLLVYASLNKILAGQPHPDRQKVEDALGWYGARLREAPGLDDVAAAVSCSRAHLRRLFQRCLQISPREAFDHLRFQRALQMLTDTEIKLRGISEACGFSEESAFSRAFKKRFGAPPSEFRSRSRRHPSNLAPS